MEAQQIFGLRSFFIIFFFFFLDDFFLSWQYSQVSTATTPSWPNGKGTAILQARGWTLVADLS